MEVVESVGALQTFFFVRGVGALVVAHTFGVVVWSVWVVLAVEVVVGVGPEIVVSGGVEVVVGWGLALWSLELSVGRWSRGW